MSPAEVVPESESMMNKGGRGRKLGNSVFCPQSAKIAKTLITSQISEAKKSDIQIYTDASRMLKRFPKHFIYHLTKMVETMEKKAKTKHETERLIADILDNLQVNLKLKPSDVKKSYEFHKNQKRLQKHLKTK